MSFDFPAEAYQRFMGRYSEPLAARFVAQLAEMRRVVAAGGRVAASVWDFDGGRSPLSLFWAAARAIDPRVRDESELAGAREGQLATLFESAGLSAIRSGELTVSVPYRDFDDWWTPYTLGVGPAGSYVASLDADHARRLRATCAAMLPSGPGVVDATAWTAVGTV